MRDKVLEILEEIKPGADFTRTDLFSGGVLKSFDMMNLVNELDDEFDIEISMVDIVPKNFESVDQIVALVGKYAEGN